MEPSRNLSFEVLKPILSFCLLASFSASSNAAIVNICGDTVCFEYDDSTAYGTAIVTGDKIAFNPTNIFALSENGEGVVTTVVPTLNVTLTTIEGYEFDSMDLDEAGDYMLWGSGSAAVVGGELRVVELPQTLLASDNITANSPLSTVNTFPDGTLHNWDASASVSLAGNEWDGINTVVMKVENILTAYTDPNDSGPLKAFLQKKELGVAIDVITTPSEIPLPAAVWLFGTGLLGLAGIARRRKTHN